MVCSCNFWVSFESEHFGTQIVARILVKALMAMPAPNFNLCLFLIPEIVLKVFFPIVTLAKPKSSCNSSIDSSCFITWTLVLLQLMTSVSLHPKVNVVILTLGLMGLYIVFICWFAIRRSRIPQVALNTKPVPPILVKTSVTFSKGE